MEHVTRNIERGFTLIEVIVSVGIFTLIIYGISALVSGILVNSNQQTNLLANNDSARKAAFGITKELRNAATSAIGGYPLVDASAQQIIFYSNTGSTVDRIRYYLQDGILYQGVVTPSGNPQIYNIASEVVRVVQKDVANGAGPVFYYYDGTYNGIAGNPLAQPVGPTAVKFVKINLVIYKKLTPASTGTYTVTAGGTVRNLKTNLGN